MIAMPDLEGALSSALAGAPDPWGADRLHVSDLSVALGTEGKCPRQLWLRHHGAKAAPPTLGKLLMFDHGKGIHERIVPILEAGLKGTGWKLEWVELSLRGLLPDEVDSGRLDVVLRGPGAVLVLDFKTMRGRAFGYLADAKPAHKLQVQTYAQAFGADGGVLLYIDREGQNGVRQFYVERDDRAVAAAATFARGIVDAPEPPAVLRPTLFVRENKGPDSIYLNEPWQCRYCEYRDVSCMGALPPVLRDLGIVAKRSQGKLFPVLGLPPSVAVMLDSLIMTDDEVAA